MKGLVREASRLSKSLDALCVFTDNLATRKVSGRRVVKASDDLDLFKATSPRVPTETAYPTNPGVRGGSTAPASGAGASQPSGSPSTNRFTETLSPTTSIPRGSSRAAGGSMGTPAGTGASQSTGSPAANRFTEIASPTISTPRGTPATPAANRYTANTPATPDELEEDPSVPKSGYRASAPLVGKNRLTLIKYSPDQPRDDHGRWTAGGIAGVAGAVLGGAALVGGGILLARNPGLWGRASRNMTSVAGKPKPMASAASAVPATRAGSAASKPAAASALRQRTTKPFSELSRRQQLRRESIVRADAVRRGATPKQADDLVAQMRARAAAAGNVTATRGAAAAEATSLKPLPAGMPTDMVRREQARVDAMVARYDSKFRQFTALEGRGEPTKQAILNREMDALAREIAARQAALESQFGTWARGSFVPPVPPKPFVPPKLPSTTRRLTVGERLSGRSKKR